MLTTYVRVCPTEWPKVRNALHDTDYVCVSSNEWPKTRNTLCDTHYACVRFTDRSKARRFPWYWLCDSGNDALKKIVTAVEQHYSLAVF